MCRNITRVDELNTSHWTGIKFILEKGEYTEIVIDNTSQCCEEWGYNILNPEIIPMLIGWYIYGIYTIEPKSAEKPDLVEDEEDDKGKACNTYEIGFGHDGIDEVKKLKVDFYNYHNGYYPHNILIYNSIDPSDCRVESI